MRYTIALAACLLLFAQCSKKNAAKTVAAPVIATGSYDTLGIHWTTVERTNIIYYFQDWGQQSEYAEEYVSLHEDAYTSLDKVFKAKLPRKLRFFVWDDANKAAQLLGYSLGFTVPEECVCYVRPEQTLGHEMTHALAHWAGGAPITEYNRFINEGVAVAFDLNPGDKIETAKDAIEGQSITSVTDLWIGRGQLAPEDILYPVAGAFMQFMYQQGQPDKFNALIKTQSYESAQFIYGEAKLDALVKDFNTRLGL